MALDRRVSSRVLGLLVLGACSIPGALAQAPTEANMIGVIVAAAILGFLLLVTLFFIAVYFIRQRDRREHRKERYRKQSGSTVANGTIAAYPDYSTLHAGYYPTHPNLFYTTLPPARLAGYRPKILASEMLVPAPYPYPYPYPYDQQSISGDEEAIPKDRRSRSADPTARAYSDGHVANHVTGRTVTTSATEYLTPVASGSDPKEVTRVDTHVTDTQPMESHEMHTMAPESYKVIRKSHKSAEKSEPRPLCELGATMDLGEEDPDAGSAHLPAGGPMGSEVTPSQARASVFQLPQEGPGSGNDDDYTIIDYLDDQIDASSSSPLPPPPAFASPLYDADLESGSPEERPELPRRCDDDDDDDDDEKDDDRDKEDGFAPASFAPPAEAEPVMSFSRPSPPPPPPPDADLPAPSPPPAPPAPPPAPPAPPAPEAAADVPGFGHKEPHTPPPHRRQNFHPPPPPPPDVPLDDDGDDDNDDDDEELEDREGRVRFGDVTQISEPSSPREGKPEGDAPPPRPPRGPPGLPAALLSEIRQAGESKAASAAAGSPDY